MTREPPPIEEVRGARALLILGDSITTDHISPVGAIPADSTAGRYLIEQGIPPRDFNSYAGRRVNHDVMLRGTFANIRLRNELVPGREGGWTVHQPSGEIATIHETALRYRAEDVPLVVVAGRDYGAGSSRDWAAKGTRLLGVRAVIAEGFERIHRSNLVGMGVLPLQFRPGEDRRRLGLDGTETYDLAGLAGGPIAGGEIACRIHRRDGTTTDIGLRCRLDTARDADYYRHGGILPYVLRTLLPPSPAPGQPG
jgi:aconitate hydratase